MNITFVLPAIGKKKGKKYIKTWQQMEPITFATLKALTPPEIKTTFFDDRIELIDYDHPTDLVAISVEIYTAKRAYFIAEQFRKRGATVILGGYHTTLYPDEARQHANAILTGNAERIWHHVISDFQANNLQPIYKGTNCNGSVLPDRSLFKGKKYSKLGVIEVGRGCHFTCEFCAISAFYRAGYHRRPVEQVVADIKAAKKAGKQLYFFVDDNIVADPAYAIELFKQLTPLHIMWTGQGALTMARNDELLYWMKKSGCTMILIGYESLYDDNLKQMNKGWSIKLGEVSTLTEKIHDAGINIYATFLFGFDYDSRELFDKTVAFALKHRFYFAAFNHLLTFPGTDLYRRLQQEKRITKDRWWLNDEYRYGQITFTPKTFTAEELAAECRRARKKFYTIPSIIKRSTAAWKRSKSLLLYIYYWILNFNLSDEVDGKIGLPMGANLDELPK